MSSYSPKFDKDLLELSLLFVLVKTILLNLLNRTDKGLTTVLVLEITVCYKNLLLIPSWLNLKQRVKFKSIQVKVHLFCITILI